MKRLTVLPFVLFFVILNPIGIVFADSNAGSIASYTFGIIENADPVHPVPIKYKKFELQVNWNGSDGYSNPFDPDEISLSENGVMKMGSSLLLTHGR